MQKPSIVFPQYRTFSSCYFSQAAHNFKITDFIDRTTMWRELMMHYETVIEEANEQNLDI